MKTLTNAVTAILPNPRETVALSVLLDGMADVPECGARANLFNAQPHAFVGNIGQTACQNGWGANVKHAAGVTEPAVFNDSDVNIKYITRFELFVAGYTV